MFRKEWFWIWIMDLDYGFVVFCVGFETDIYGSFVERT